MRAALPQLEAREFLISTSCSVNRPECIFSAYGASYPHQYVGLSDCLVLKCSGVNCGWQIVGGIWFSYKDRCLRILHSSEVNVYDINIAKPPVHRIGLPLPKGSDLYVGLPSCAQGLF